MADTIKTKRCSTCKEILPLSEFHKNHTHRDSLQSYCKNCERQYKQSEKYKQGRKRYAQTEKHKQYQKQYFQTDKGKQARKRHNQTEKRKQTHKHYRKNNPEKTKARCKINGAVRAGKLLPARHYWCACGNQAVDYHHHKGYDKPHWFDVIPVCKLCHLRIHGLAG